MLLHVSFQLNHHQAAWSLCFAKLQNRCQLIYFVIKLFGRVAAY
jgi:hypothetical protein